MGNSDIERREGNEEEEIKTAEIKKSTQNLKDEIVRKTCNRMRKYRRR